MKFAIVKTSKEDNKFTLILVKSQIRSLGFLTKGSQAN